MSYESPRGGITVVTENGRETQSHLIIRWKLKTENPNLLAYVTTERLVSIGSCKQNKGQQNYCSQVTSLLLSIVRNARPSDSGNYTCKPSIFKTAAVRLHVLTGWTKMSSYTYLYPLNMLIPCNSILTNLSMCFIQNDLLVNSHKKGSTMGELTWGIGLLVKQNYYKLGARKKVNSWKNKTRES